MQFRKIVFHNHAVQFYILSVLFLSTPLIIFFLAVPPPPVYLTWDWASALGYLAATMVLLLFLYPIIMYRIPGLSGRFFSDFHRHAGFVIFILAFLHVLIMLIEEPLLIEHIKPTAPAYMLSGLLAWILLALLVIFSLKKTRQKLFKDTGIFRNFHIFGGCLIILLICYHITTSGYYANTLWKQGLWLSFSLGSIIYALVRKRSTGEEIVPEVQKNKDITLVESSAGLFVLGAIAWSMAVILNM